MTPPPVLASAAVSAPPPPPPIPPITNKAPLSRPTNTKPVLAAPAPDASTSCCGCSLAWAKQNVLPLLSWEDPVNTGAAFAAGVGAFFVFGVLRVGLFSFFAYSVLAAIALSGAVHAGIAYHAIPERFASLASVPACACEAFPATAARWVETTLAGARADAITVVTWSKPLFSFQVRALGCDWGVCVFACVSV